MQGTEGKKSKSMFFVLRDCSSILSNKLHSKDIKMKTKTQQQIYLQMYAL